MTVDRTNHILGPKSVCEVCDRPPDDDAGGDLVAWPDWRVSDPVLTHWRCAPAHWRAAWRMGDRVTPHRPI